MTFKRLTTLSLAVILSGCATTTKEDARLPDQTMNRVKPPQPLWYKIDNEGSGSESVQILSKTPMKLSKEAAKRLFKSFLAAKYNNIETVKPLTSNQVANQPVEFNSEINEVEVSVPDPKLLYHQKMGDIFFAKYEMNRTEIVEHLALRNKEIQKKIETLRNNAIYSEDPYFQYKFFQEIERLLSAFYRNLGLMNVAAEEEKAFEEEVSYINRNLYTFYKIKNNLNFKIHDSNDDNLIKFIKLSLIEKNLNMTLEPNEYTLYLDVNLNKIGENVSGEGDLYVVTIDITDQNGDIYNSITFDTSIKFDENREKTMYGLYKEIYRTLNETDFFGGRIIP